MARRNRALSQCAIHLRKYNDALLINATVRMVDALRVLEEFYSSREGVALDGTDLFLSGLFQGQSIHLVLEKDSKINTENYLLMACNFQNMIDNDHIAPSQKTMWS